MNFHYTATPKVQKKKFCFSEVTVASNAAPGVRYFSEIVVVHKTQFNDENYILFNPDTSRRSHVTREQIYRITIINL